MYSSGYSQVSMHSLQPQKKMQYRSKGKSCGYYMRIVFFFSSLIQSLIIVSLVLFLIYGKKQDSASVSRIQDLEESFSRLSIENVALRQQRKNLTTLLNSTLIEKARNDWDLATLRFLSNRSVIIIDDFRNKLRQCSEEMFSCRSRIVLSGPCPQMIPGNCNCGLLLEQMKARLTLVESNFTQTRERMNRGLEQMAKERDNLNLQAISLRRDKFTLEKQVEFCRQKCKDDFAQSLSGVTNVTKAFLRKVDSLFPAHIAFQLTCPKQREHLEQIRTNCTSLSREVEDKFQGYLNNVGEQVSSIQAESILLKAENWRLSDDYRWCSQNRSALVQQHKQNTDKLQRKHDEDKEKLLIDKMRLNGEIEVLHNSVNYKSKEVEHLKEQLKQLNMTCMTRTGFGGYPGGSPSRTGTSQSGWGMFGGGGSSSASSSSSGGGQAGRTGSGSSYGSSGSTYNKPGSTGTGSSGGSSSSTGFGFNKPGSTGTGSSSTSLSSGGSSSSTGHGFNKPGSTGTGSSSTSLSSSASGSSTGLGYNKPGSTGGVFSSFGSTGSKSNLGSSGIGSTKAATSGKASSGYGSSSGSTGSSPNLSSSGTGSNKPTSNAKSPSASGSSTGSTGSPSKSGSSSSGLSWFGFGNSGQSKTGSGTGKGTSSGSSSSGTGSIFGGGRTSSLGGGSVSVSQHLQDLQRLINPARPEEKQDLSRILG